MSRIEPTHAEFALLARPKTPAVSDDISHHRGVSMGYASIHNLAIPHVLLTAVERDEIWVLELATVQKTCDIS